MKQGVVDYATAKWLLLGSIPAIVLGSLAAHWVDPTLLELVFGAGLLLLGGFILSYPSPEACEPGEKADEKSGDDVETVIETTDGETYRYRTCWRTPGSGWRASAGSSPGSSAPDSRNSSRRNW